MDGATLLNRIRKYCKENDIRIYEFEKKCGLSNGTVSGWGSGEPKLTSLDKIVKATGKPIEYWWS